MPTPFFRKLAKKHTVPRVTSYTDTDHARELQRLVDANDNAGYESKRLEFEEAGEEFRLTKGIVFESRHEGEEMEVEIAVQVKGTSLTWYFWTPDGGMDEYPQEFRNKLYNAAAECHRSVENGCDLYYRGSNSVHIKLMHHQETESNNNHNHYRLKNNQHYQPHDFNQHMRAFTGHEMHDTFFEAGEVDALCSEFAAFHQVWTAEQEDAPSLSEQYQSEPEQKLTLGDTAEIRIFGHQQEPCRIDVAELKFDYEAARRLLEASLNTDGEDSEEFEALCEQMEQEYQDLIAYRQLGGSRGLGSERASSRQVEGSANPTIKAVMRKDDELKSKLPSVPSWASSVRREVDTAMGELFSPLKTRERELGYEDELNSTLGKSSSETLFQTPPSSGQSTSSSLDLADSLHRTASSSSDSEEVISSSRRSRLSSQDLGELQTRGRRSSEALDLAVTTDMKAKLGKLKRDSPHGVDELHEDRPTRPSPGKSSGGDDH
ncbi:MAG: hypothetical protein K0U37_07930 [Gammaproteobacteria bacterium]|nr:hypothetical protein [Gammaproteobacteria bacterium]